MVSAKNQRALCEVSISAVGVFLQLEVGGNGREVALCTTVYSEYTVV